jgi:hypothetical protein
MKAIKENIAVGCDKPTKSVGAVRREEPKRQAKKARRKKPESTKGRDVLVQQLDAEEK